MTYLSTNITPYDRKNRIDTIKDNIKRKERQIVVTTQLVEAGVDIDFDVVYRDFAPIDSLVQSAGRCNRNGEKEKGSIHVIKLINKDGNPYCDKIYDGVLLQETGKILSNIQVIDEKNIYDVVDKYFQNVKEHVSDDKSNEILQALKMFHFSDIRKSFQLIKNQPYKIDVFVPQNNEAIQVLNQVQDIITRLKKTKDRDEKYKIKEEFDKIKSEFYQFVISVNRNKITEDKKASEYQGFFMPVIQRKYYKDETGFDDSEDDCPYYMV